jgi:hypothetical protein
MKSFKTKTISILGVKTLLMLFMLSSCELFKEEKSFGGKRQDHTANYLLWFGPGIG